MTRPAPPSYPEPVDVPPYLPDGSPNPAWPPSYRDIAAKTAWLRYRALDEVEMVEALVLYTETEREDGVRGPLSADWADRDVFGTGRRVTLDQAWAEAEAALPRDALIRVGRTGMSATGWATAYLHGEHLATEFHNDGPAAALQALTAKLRGQT